MSPMLEQKGIRKYHCHIMTHIVKPMYVAHVFKV